MGAACGQLCAAAVRIPAGSYCGLRSAMAQRLSFGARSCGAHSSRGRRACDSFQDQQRGGTGHAQLQGCFMGPAGALDSCTCLFCLLPTARCCLGKACCQQCLSRLVRSVRVDVVCYWEVLGYVLSVTLLCSLHVSHLRCVVCGVKVQAEVRRTCGVFAEGFHGWC